MKKFSALILAIVFIVMIFAGCEQEVIPPEFLNTTTGTSGAPTSPEEPDETQATEPEETEATEPTDSNVLRMIVADIPAEAEEIESSSTSGHEQTYTYFYNAVATISVGRFAKEKDREAFLDKRRGGKLTETQAYTTEGSGISGILETWEAGGNEDTAECDAFYFDADGYYYLFFTSVPADYYFGFMDDIGGPNESDVKAWMDSVRLE